MTETTEAPPYATAKAWRRFTCKTVATATHTIWLGALADDGYGRFHDPDYTDEALPAAFRSGTVRVSRWLWWPGMGPCPPARWSCTALTCRSGSGQGPPAGAADQQADQRFAAP